MQTRRRDPWTGHATTDSPEPPRQTWRELLADLVFAFVAVALITGSVAIVTGVLG